MLLRHRRLQEATEKANEPHFLEERKGKPSHSKMTPEADNLAPDFWAVCPFPSTENIHEDILRHQSPLLQRKLYRSRNRFSCLRVDRKSVIADRVDKGEVYQSPVIINHDTTHRTGRHAAFLSELRNVDAAGPNDRTGLEHIISACVPAYRPARSRGSVLRLASMLPGTTARHSG